MKRRGHSEGRQSEAGCMKWSFPKQTPSFLSQALVAPSAFHRGERTWTVTLRGFPVMPCETAQASPSSGTRRIQSTLAGPRKEAGLGVLEPPPCRRHRGSRPAAHPTTEILCPQPQPLRFSHRTWSLRAASPRREGPPGTSRPRGVSLPCFYSRTSYRPRTV